MARKQAILESAKQQVQPEMPMMNLAGQVAEQRPDPKWEEERHLRDEASRAINRYVVHCATVTGNTHGVVVGAQALEKLRGW